MAPTPKPAVDRFWSMVSVIDDEDSCWEWLGSTKRGGYGKLEVDGENIRANRFSYELHNGPIPFGMNVLHRCDNRKCVRPSHLFLGTHQDNMSDRNRKGRHSHRLSEEDVKIIRSSPQSVASLAREFSINYRYCWKIKHGRARCQQ